MKVLFDHPNPFLLAHGGLQIQIEQTKAGLEKLGVEVEYLRWWDDRQTGNIIHYFGRPRIHYLNYAHQKGMKLVVAQILTGLGSRPKWSLPFQRGFIQIAGKVLPRTVSEWFAWEAPIHADACVVLTSWEGYLTEYVYRAVPEKVHVVPNGVEATFLESRPAIRGPWLVCTATITPRKRVLELAEAAVIANTPLWIIGKAYSDTEDYAQRFLKLAKEHPQYVRFEGPVNDRAQLAKIYREARGFVLLSTRESLSLSALEAAATECPLLLSDLPWGTSVFGEYAKLCPIASPQRTAPFLRAFYDAAPTIKPPPRPASWMDIAAKLKQVYERILTTSR